jgi:hypothetical protein
MKNIHSIPKESVPGTRFFPSEVITDKAQRQWRLYDLQRALILSNIDHCHANIIFKTSEGSLQQVQATIWSVSDDFVLLKGGAFIPVRAIIALEY